MNNNPFLSASEPASSAPHPHRNPPHHILMVDDDSSIRKISAQALADSGYRVDAAEDGSAAWEVLQTQEFNLLITDHLMPKVSGVELLQKLHAVRMALPVIMITGAVPHEEFARSPWLQPAATLIKPYTIAELLGMVREVLRVTDVAREYL